MSKENFKFIRNDKLKVKQISGNIGSKVSANINAENKVIQKGAEKVDRIVKFRREASRMASMANKRIKRLESNSLQSSPAYQGYLKSGGEKFSVRGKDYNELQAEVARMKRFIDANTSTVRGVNSYLKGIAKDTGLKYKNLEDLRNKADKFFELAAKTEEYLRTVEDMASAIGYQKIWESINQYVSTNKIDLSATELSVDDMIEEVTKALTEYKKPEYVSGHFFKLTND